MTEKDYNPEKRNAKSMNKIEKMEKSKLDETKVSNKIVDNKKNSEPAQVEQTQQKISDKSSEINEKKPEGKKEDIKKDSKKVDGIKKKPKYEASINSRSLPISTKHAIALCRYVKGKKIDDAIRELEDVLIGKRPIPMKGEIPHRKGKVTGKTSGSGRFPENATRIFIKLLKSLSGNVTANNLEDHGKDLKINYASANVASMPHGRDGTRKKRSHVSLKVIVLKDSKNKKQSKNKGNKKAITHTHREVREIRR
jgi:ribosomal protein L22